MKNKKSSLSRELTIDGIVITLVMLLTMAALLSGYHATKPKAVPPPVLLATNTSSVSSSAVATLESDMIPFVETVAIPVAPIEESIRTNSIVILTTNQTVTAVASWTVYTLTDGIDTITFSDATGETERVLGAPGISEAKLENWTKICVDLRDNGIIPKSTKKARIQYTTLW